MCVVEARQAGTVPITVPRTSALGEHVDDHQHAFCGGSPRRACCTCRPTRRTLHRLHRRGSGRPGRLRCRPRHRGHRAGTHGRPPGSPRWSTSWCDRAPSAPGAADRGLRTQRLDAARAHARLGARRHRDRRDRAPVGARRARRRAVQLRRTVLDVPVLVRGGPGGLRGLGSAGRARDRGAAQRRRPHPAPARPARRRARRPAGGCGATTWRASWARSTAGSRSCQERDCSSTPARCPPTRGCCGTRGSTCTASRWSVTRAASPTPWASRCRVPRWSTTTRCIGRARSSRRCGGRPSTCCSVPWRCAAPR